MVRQYNENADYDKECMEFDYHKINDNDIDIDVFKYIENNVEEVYHDGNAEYTDNMVFNDDLIYFMRKFKNGKLKNINRELFNKYLSYIKKLFVKMNLELTEGELYAGEESRWSVYTSVPDYITYENFCDDTYGPFLAYVDIDLKRIYYTFESSGLKLDVTLGENDKTIENVYKKLACILHSKNNELFKGISVSLNNNFQLDLLKELVDRNNKRYSVSFKKDPYADGYGEYDNYDDDRIVLVPLHCNFDNLLGFCKGETDEKFIKEYHELTRRQTFYKLDKFGILYIMSNILHNYVIKPNTSRNINYHGIGVHDGVIVGRTLLLILDESYDYSFIAASIGEYRDTYKGLKIAIIRRGSFNVIDKDGYVVIGLYDLMTNKEIRKRFDIDE